MTVGVLAVQGAFIEHIQMLKKLQVETVEIRKKEDLKHPFDGLIFPGGESTTMGKLLRDLELFEPIKQMISDGMPVFGTCAGMILLANQIHESETAHLGTMDICVRRNAYGRQLGSFQVSSSFAEQEGISMPFIRAPYICIAGPSVQLLSVVQDKIVAARQDNQLVAAFHPELTQDTRVHQYFLDMVQSRQNRIV